MSTKVRRLLPALPPLELSLGVIQRLSTINGVATTTRLRNAISDLTMELSMDGASVFSIEIVDPDYSILKNRTLLQDRLDLDLGERFAGFGRWRMHTPNQVGGFSTQGITTTLNFWDLGAASLKAQTGALRKSRTMSIEALVQLLAREGRRAQRLRLGRRHATPRRDAADRRHRERHLRGLWVLEQRGEERQARRADAHDRADAQRQRGVAGGRRRQGAGTCRARARVGVHRRARGLQGLGAVRQSRRR